MSYRQALARLPQYPLARRADQVARTTRPRQARSQGLLFIEKGKAFMKRWTCIALTALALGGLAACSTHPSAHPTTGSTMPASNLNTRLQAFHWDLERAEDASGRALPVFTALAPQRLVRLSFVAGEQPGQQRVVVDRLCNGLGAGYELKGTDIRISRPISTMMACPDQRLMQLEQAVGAQLGEATRVQMPADGQPPRLTLHFKDGSRWHMVGQPTAATRYGSAGETLFLEVGPELKPCSHGVARGVQCMQVREVQYNSAGLKTSTGEWGHFYGMIEGFAHEPGVRNVLRVKRYTRQNPPADASRYVYQLDMRVESERVGTR